MELLASSDPVYWGPHAHGMVMVVDESRMNRV
jgi:hypothetical protein